MITIRKLETGRLAAVDAAEKNVWVDVINPTKDEQSLLEREYRLNAEHMQDILDIDEQARIEKEDEYTLLIVRLPVYDPRLEVSYYTVPCGILLLPDRIVTVCQADSEVLEELRSGRVRNVDPKDKMRFILQFFGRSAIVYLRYLKDINRRTAVIERELQRSVKNHELTQLLALEKSLVYFTTSLKTNEIVLEKMPTAKSIRLKDEDDVELHEDVLTDNKQAIEMANIYSDILSGMMDAFASVISNNLNMQMKRLTILSIVLMIPTLIASMFGMNVTIPFESHPYAFAIILGVCLFAALFGAVLLVDRRPKRLPNRRSKLAAPAVTGAVVRRHG